MFDPKSLLEQVLGAATGTGTSAPGGTSGVEGLKQKFGNSALNSFGGGAAMGGVLGLLLGGKGMRKLAGGAVGYGGAAALGALALRAFQNYQQGKVAQGTAPATRAEIEAIPASQLPHAQPNPDSAGFALTLLRAMIGAAKADGVMSADEQQHIFASVEKLGLDAQSKAAVFDMISRPLDLAQLDSSVGSEPQRGEIYLAARLATDADHPAERAYLDALAGRLGLPAGLRAHLDKQATT